jgi:hypothetical protein
MAKEQDTRYSRSVLGCENEIGYPDEVAAGDADCEQYFQLHTVVLKTTFL